MADRKLAAYVREQLHRGYSIASIKTVLVQSGYASRDVDQTLRSVRYRPFFFGAVILLVFSLVVGFIFSLISPVGDNTLSVSPSSPQSLSPHPETTLQSTTSEPHSLSLPQERVANSKFHIISNETSSHPLSPPLPDGDFHDIIQLAHENPEKARSLCLDLSSLTDSCLLASGLATSKSEFCIGINNGDKRDSCYFNIVIATKEHQLCSSLTNPHLRDTCAQLS